MYNIILIDIDNTLLDFDKAEDRAIKVSLNKFGINPTPYVVSRFKEININLWKEFELGKISKDRLLEKRFEDLFTLLKNEDYLKNNISRSINIHYLNELSMSSDLMPNAYEVLKELSNYTKIYPVTNGVYNTQMNRINNSLIKDYFSKIFISEKIGIQKPEKGFFDFVFQDLNIKNKDSVLLVGDSLTADIIGGINYGIDTCWYNPQDLPNVNCQPKYIIKDLKELLKIIEIKQHA